MICSMTGYGAAQHVEDGVSYAVELRSVNNRYLKLNVKLPEHLQFAEPAVEKLLRSRLSRGSVFLTLRIRTQSGSDVTRINLGVLQDYIAQITQAKAPPGVQMTLDLASLADLPGVCDSPEIDDAQREKQTLLIERLSARALDAMTAMRKDEGRALRDDLLNCCATIRARLGEVAQRAPVVVQEYHDRLKSRVAALMQQSKLELEADSLMREVAIYAERCDINEELSRITSHLDQFADLCNRGDQVGRTLDFLAQELLREANTIASKSNDAAIARSIVEVKGLIDRLKEQVQNVE